MRKYRKLNNCESFEFDPKKQVLRFACCDCGLVHDIAMDVSKAGKIKIAMQRLNRSTAQLRRYKFGDLQTGKSKWRFVKS